MQIMVIIIKTVITRAMEGMKNGTGKIIRQIGIIGLITDTMNMMTGIDGDKTMGGKKIFT